VLAGRPNAGKSSLFNTLVQRFPASAEKSQALVSEVAGTTRDYLSAAIEFRGITCELIDTAGVDATETAGIPGLAQEMTSGQLRQASCTVWCVDPSSADRDNALAGFSAGEHKLLVFTKADLIPLGYMPASNTKAIHCSSRSGEGLEELAKAIKIIVSREEATAVASTAARCTGSLVRAQESLGSALNLVGTGGGEELIAAEVRGVLAELGQVVGAVYTDDILDRIFSTFCIGK
jgi:tRNA modification GTPase